MAHMLKLTKQFLFINAILDECQEQRNYDPHITEIDLNKSKGNSKDISDYKNRRCLLFEFSLSEIVFM